jgi:hypothetical protein
MPVSETTSSTAATPALWRMRRPTAPQPDGQGAPAFALDGAVAQRRIGLRHEGSWRSWLLIVDDWVSALRGDGAEPLVLQAGGRVGIDGVRTVHDIEVWAGEVEAGVSGLGTCGSCTSNSVKDAVTLEARGLPAVVAVCEEFEAHARNMARFLGHPALKVLVFPYPLEARPEAELHQIAEDYYPRFLELIGAKR